LEEGDSDGCFELAEIRYHSSFVGMLIPDLGMQMHEALFQTNYQHGYILKPQTLLPASHPPSSHHPTPYESKPCRVKLDVHVISGQQLPRPKDYKLGQTVDPYVQIELICPNGQTSEGRTRAVRDNEFNPMWDERIACEMTTPSHEFVFVRYFPRPHNGVDVKVFIA
jgi:phosphatidylinositol phospholipase C, delta